MVGSMHASALPLFVALGYAAGMNVVEVPVTGPLLSSEQDALDIVGALYGSGADVVVIPVQRMAADFWLLETKLAGHFIQKLRNYGVRPAFVGDLTSAIAASKALADYVRECNRRKDVLFASTRAELDALLR
jgi:hypothetical protein